MSEQQTENGDKTYEEDGYDNPGIKGQIQYPEEVVDAERAGNYAAYKEEFLYPEGEEPEGVYRGYNTVYNTELETGDETGEETEPTNNPDFDPNDPEHHE
jgi:hypothetical protein